MIISLLAFVGRILFIILGFYILFAGRHAIWATLGIIAMSAAADLLAVLVAGGSVGTDLLVMQEWGLLAIAVVAGVLGIALGKYKKDLAVRFIGFLAGADAAILFYDITTHLMTNVAQSSETIAFWSAIVLLIAGGLLGLWLVQAARDEALILITMLMGTQLILGTFGFNSSSSWTAIIMITLALAGVLVQYATYLREIKSNQLHPEPQPSSLAYFQDLELDS